MSKTQNTLDNPSVQTMTMAGALNAGLERALEDHPKALLMGEDIGRLGGVFRVTEGLQEKFGESRVMDTPLAESGIVGTAIGLSMRGYSPVCEIQFDGFVFPAFNQITSQLAKMHKRTEGQIDLPVVIRIPYGGVIGSIEHHSESPEAYFAHTPGLRVMTPSSVNDAYWMIQEAIASPDPVIFLEPKRRYWMKGEVDIQNSPFGVVEHSQEIGAEIIREGQDATIVTYGPLVPTALAAAEAALEDGHSIEVIDLKSLSPIDFDTIEESVKKTGRLLVTHEAPTFGGISGEIASRVGERAFYYLEAPVKRVGGFHTPYPVSKVEENYVPNLDRILDGVEELLTHQ